MIIRSRCWVLIRLFSTNIILWTFPTSGPWMLGPQGPSSLYRSIHNLPHSLQAIITYTNQLPQQLHQQAQKSWLSFSKLSPLQFRPRYCSICRIPRSLILGNGVPGMIFPRNWQRGSQPPSGLMSNARSFGVFLLTQFVVSPIGWPSVSLNSSRVDALK